MRRLMILWLLAALAGCSGDAPAAVTAPPVSAPAARATPTRTPLIFGDPGSIIPEEFQTVIASFETSGGMKGISQRLDVLNDGGILMHSTGGNVGEVSGTGRTHSDQMSALRDLIGSPEFQALKPEYLPANTCCDRITYVITVPREGGEQTITTIDGEDWPELLARAIRLFQELQTQVILDR